MLQSITCRVKELDHKYSKLFSPSIEEIEFGISLKNLQSLLINSPDEPQLTQHMRSLARARESTREELRRELALLQTPGVYVIVEELKSIFLGETRKYTSAPHSGDRVPVAESLFQWFDSHLHKSVPLNRTTCEASGCENDCMWSGGGHYVGDITTTYDNSVASDLVSLPAGLEDKTYHISVTRQPSRGCYNNISTGMRFVCSVTRL
jgi:hypothetical protein